MGGDFNADVIINIPPAFFSLQKSGLVRVYLTSVFLLLSVPRCFGDQKPQFDYLSTYEGWLAFEAQQVQNWLLFHPIYGGCFGQLQERY